MCGCLSPRQARVDVFQDARGGFFAGARRCRGTGRKIGAPPAGTPSLQCWLFIRAKVDSWLDCGLVAYEASQREVEDDFTEFDEQNKFEARLMSYASYDMASSLAQLDGRTPRKKMMGNRRVFQIWDTEMRS